MVLADRLESEVDRATGPVRVVILGSTGSIGQSALAVIRAHPERYRVVGLLAGSNVKLLKAQVLEFKPDIVALADPQAARVLESELAGTGTPVLGGAQVADELAASNAADMVLVAIVGFAGLQPVLTALKAGKLVALANKESLVCGGALVRAAAKAGGGRIIPVDSEHSAIFQVLQGERRADLKKLILTASGGPFLDWPLDKLEQVTVTQALEHPRWKMGPKITIDSATMVNKALEVIEAYWLFNVEPEQIKVIVHPQSIVHSLIELQDGTQLAQLSVPDMRGPIAYALNYPYGRLDNVLASLDLEVVGQLSFLPLDHDRFPAIRLAREVLAAGGRAPAVFNLANEVAVDLFLKEQIGFTDIYALVQRSLDRFGVGGYSSCSELEELGVEVEGWVRQQQRIVSSNIVLG